MGELEAFRRDLRDGRIAFSGSNLRILWSRVRSRDRIISRSPHAQLWFRKAITQIGARGGAFGLMSEYLAGRFRCGALLRHDVDTSRCVEQLHVLTDVETDRGVTSTIYVLGDSHFYPVASPSSQLRVLQERGFEIGLHSRAHFQPDPRDYLRREIDAFEQAHGDRPATVTMHGEYPRPPQYFERKKAFQDAWEELEAEFGVVFLNRKKPLTLTDAAFDGPDIATRRSLLYASFTDPFLSLYRDPTGALPTFQLNTHPLYWGQ